MTTLDEFAKNRAPLPEIPKGFEAVVESDGKGGLAKNIAVPEAENADDRALIYGAGLDPAVWVITPGTRRHKRWQRYDGEWLNWWSFNFEPRVEMSAAERAAELKDLNALFRKKPLKRASIGTGTEAAAFPWCDHQIGKGEGGGTPATIERVRDGIQQSVEWVKAMRRAGAKMPVGMLAGTGDLHEGCMGFYPMQEYQVDADRREQNKIVRRLMREGVEELSPLFDRFLVTGVGGNHGENRKDGKAYTTFADNDDVAALEVVEELFSARSGFENVEFYIPDDELAIVLDVNGVNVGLAHGHQFGKGGSTPQKKAEAWWAYQTFGRQPMAAAQVLVTGHYHHESVNTYGSRTHIQAPSQDGGSLWFKNSSGVDSPTGQMVIRLDSEHPLGVRSVEVLPT